MENVDLSDTPQRNRSLLDYDDLLIKRASSFLEHVLSWNTVLKTQLHGAASSRAIYCIANWQLLCSVSRKLCPRCPLVGFFYTKKKKALLVPDFHSRQMLGFYLAPVCPLLSWQTFLNGRLHGLMCNRWKPDPGSLPLSGLHNAHTWADCHPVTIPATSELPFAIAFLS